MSIVRNREIRGILGIVVIILVLGGIMAGMSGMLEQWGLWSSGSKALDKVVFVSDSSGTPEIYLMNTDGSDRKQLTSGARVGSIPAICPAGNRIAFYGSAKGAGAILRVDADGGTPEPIARGDGHPAFSPDGKKLSYMASGKVEVADLSGDNPDPVLPTHAEIHNAMSNPVERGKVPAYTSYAWGPNSDSMAGVTRDMAGNDILVLLRKLEGDIVPLVNVAKTPDGKSFVLISTKLGSQSAPFLPVGDGQSVRVTNLAWAAKKSVLVTTIVAGGASVLFMFNVEQGTGRPLVEVKDQEVTGVGISPDGSAVVFAVRTRDGKSTSGLMKLDMAAANGGIIAKGVFEAPIYSPKGDRVLAIACDEGKGTRNVVSIDPSDGQVKQLTTDGHSVAAIWSPVSEE